MIDRIKGKCLSKSPAKVILEISGLGLSLAVPLSTYEKIGAVGSELMLFTYLYVREDTLDLYGFSTVDERDLFVQLIAVSGIGPKMALAIQSRFTPNELFRVVSDGDSRRLTSVKGIGPKTAERLMLELKGRLERGIRDAEFEPVTGQLSPVGEAVQALEALGFTIKQADDAVRKARKKVGDDTLVEELVRMALKG
ncbi:MAG: Holliday junction branch migration protein RuvA [Candidatus Hatepunaea meridiana]|nr:Holliday junction branch migration protein RuvA [Candidatus Hatepunaea meridiana]